MRQIALGLAIGSVGAYISYRVHMPLPWFLGSLTFCLVAAVLNLPYQPPKILSIPARAVLGVAVGTAFSPALLSRLPGISASLLLLLPWMALIMLAGPPFFRRLAGFDHQTAFFASVPGGLTDMVTMAEDIGAHTRTITLIQGTRIVLIVFALPFWLQWHDGFDIAARTMTGRLHLLDLSVLDGAMLIALGWAGWFVAARYGLAGAAIVGPMLLSGTVHASGLTAAKMPFEVMTAAQVVLGVILGNQFRGLTFAELRSTMTWGLAFSLLLLVGSAVTAEIVHALTGFAVLPVLMGFAPGGQSEINLLAYVLNLDVAFVALHHLVRLAVVIFAAQWMFRRMKAGRR